MSQMFDISSYYITHKNFDGWILKRIDSEQTLFLSNEELISHGFKHSRDNDVIVPILVPSISTRLAKNTAPVLSEKPPRLTRTGQPVNMDK